MALKSGGRNADACHTFQTYQTLQVESIFDLLKPAVLCKRRASK